MKKIYCLLIPILVIGMFFCGCDVQQSSSLKQSSKLQIEVSVNYLQEFVSEIGGDKVDVECLVPNNVEPHEYELKTRDFENVINKDLFVYNGLGMEEWIDNLQNQVTNSDVQFVEAGKNVDVIENDGKRDPHIWLSLKESIKICDSIKEALINKDPDNESYYTDNFNRYKQSLENLYEEYKPKFDSLNQKSFVTSHEAFGYLCREYGLSQQYLNDMFGEGEVTPKKYEELAIYCKQKNINTIFSESSESTKEAETLANEINGKVEGISTLETKVEGKSYLEVMKSNYEIIIKSLS